YRPFLRAAENRHLAVLKRGVRRLLEAVHLVERGVLLFIGEHDVGTFPRQSAEVVPVTVYAEAVGSAESDIHPRSARTTGGVAAGLLRLVAIDQIAFQIDDLRIFDHRLIDIGGSEVDARTKKRVHGALAVRRHEYEAAGGRRAVGRWRGLVDYALR